MQPGEILAHTRVIRLPVVDRQDAEAAGLVAIADLLSAGSSSWQAVHHVAQNVSSTGRPLKSIRLTLLSLRSQELKTGAVPPTRARPPDTEAVFAELPALTIPTAVAVAATTTRSGRASAHFGTGRVGGLRSLAPAELDHWIRDASRLRSKLPRIEGQGTRARNEIAQWGPIPDRCAEHAKPTRQRLRPGRWRPIRRLGRAKTIGNRLTATIRSA